MMLRVVTDLKRAKDWSDMTKYHLGIKLLHAEHGSPLFANYMPGNERDRFEACWSYTTREKSAEFDLYRSCGTSSSGSAAAVASFMVPIALSSQTASSTIRPASYCGIYGYKPSFGLLPRTAMLKTTDTLDTVGIMARSVADLKMTFEQLKVQGDNYPVINKEMLRPDRKRKKAENWCIGVLEGPKSSLEGKRCQGRFKSNCKIIIG